MKSHQNQVQTPKKIEYSAPGKTILSGEHSVVYNKNAIAMAVDLRTRVLIQIIECKNNANYDQNGFKQDDCMQNIQNIIEFLELIETGNPHYSFEEFQNLVGKEKIENKQQKSQLIMAFILYLISYSFIAEQQILKPEFIQKMKNKLSASEIFIQSTTNLPISKGLGSSASFNVALSAAIYEMIYFLYGDQQLYSKQFSSENWQNLLEKVNSLSFELEKIYHGTPSGIDNYVCTYGGLIIYNKGEKQPKLLGEFTLPYYLYLIDSMMDKDTKKAVQKVKQVCDDQLFGDIGKQSIEMIGKTTDKFIQILDCHSLSTTSNNIEIQKQQFEELIRINQSLLRLFSLSNHKIETIQAISMQYNIPCKITGAGQGGYCLAFVPKSANQQEKSAYLKSQGFEYMDANISADGLRRHQQETPVAQL